MLIVILIIILWSINRIKLIACSYFLEQPKVEPVWEYHILDSVTVQIPVFNEDIITLENIVDRVFNFRYANHKLDVMILDDSTDIMMRLYNDELVDAYRRSKHLTIHRRDNRSNTKAGALEQALVRTKGDLIAIFDSDFEPMSDFLVRIVPYFNDEDVGVVQARWEIKNRNDSWISKALATSQDAFYDVDMAARNIIGGVHFCGSAGVWRKQCIEHSGGWLGNSIAEDVELSFKAMMNGWKIRYASDIKVPSLVPTKLRDTVIQWRRWRQGVYVIAINMLPEMYRKLPLKVFEEIFFNLMTPFKDLITVIGWIMFAFTQNKVLGAWLIIDQIIAAVYYMRSPYSRYRDLPYVMIWNVIQMIVSAKAVVDTLIKRNYEWKVTPK